MLKVPCRGGEGESTFKPPISYFPFLNFMCLKPWFLSITYITGYQQWHDSLLLGSNFQTSYFTYLTPHPDIGHKLFTSTSSTNSPRYFHECTRAHFLSTIEGLREVCDLEIHPFKMTLTIKWLSVYVYLSSSTLPSTLPSNITWKVTQLVGPLILCVVVVVSWYDTSNKSVDTFVEHA